MVIISLYCTEERDGKVYVRSKEESVCPVCYRSMRVIGSRERKAIDSNGVKQIYIIRRLHCGHCKHIHHELPDFLVPFKRHCAETIEKIISEPNDTSASGTITRSLVSRITLWWNVVGTYFGYVLVMLEHRYGIALSGVTRPREIIRAVVNSSN